MVRHNLLLRALLRQLGPAAARRSLLDAYVYWTGADRLVVLDIEGVWRIWEELAHPLRNELIGAARGILAGEDALLWRKYRPSPRLDVLKTLRRAHIPDLIIDKDETTGPGEIITHEVGDTHSSIRASLASILDKKAEFRKVDLPIP